MSWSLRGEALYPGALLTTGCAGRGGWSHNAGSTFQDVFGEESLRIDPSGQIKLSCWGGTAGGESLITASKGIPAGSRWEPRLGKT